VKTPARQKDCPKEKVCFEAFEIHKEKRNEGEGLRQKRVRRKSFNLATQTPPTD
jgi:hypothetical protein